MLASEDPECNLSSSGDSHTPQRRPLHFWLNEPTAAVPSDAKRRTIFHAFPRPILLQSVSVSEWVCPPPAKAIIYITSLQRKHNRCFLWKTKRQCVIGAICFSSVSVQTMWESWCVVKRKLVNKTKLNRQMMEMTCLKIVLKWSLRSLSEANLHGGLKIIHLRFVVVFVISCCKCLVQKICPDI